MQIEDMTFDDTLEVEQQMIDIMLNMCLQKDDIADWQFIETHKKKSQYAKVDGILVKNGNMVASVENRGRYKTTWEYIKKEGTFLLTHEKLLDNIQLSRILQIPFLFCAFFPNEKIYLMLKVTDSKGNPIIRYDVEETWARKNKNTEEKVKKPNAYIPINQFKTYKL
jgi:hypothetical protein